MSVAPGPALILGGAGFIGTNLAARLLAGGERVRIFDDLSRPGVAANLAWLRRAFPSRDRELELVRADVRDRRAVAEAVADASAVFHLAAQVAVTTSIGAPRQDFEINAGGTLNVLEALRVRASKTASQTPLVYTSTNKVYGDLGETSRAGLALAEGPRRHTPAAPELAAGGVDEDQPLRLHSPYGCSKGAADQYVLDYARIYGLANVVVRMSCIYGPHQLGTEDQGWLAHFALRTMTGAPITIYGDGKQVRDLLYVDDLVAALDLARTAADRLRGHAFNLGGTPARSLSLLEALDQLAVVTGRTPQLRFGPARPGDQRWYASNVDRFTTATGWTPTTSVADGIRQLHEWLLGWLAQPRTHADLAGGSNSASGLAR